MDFIDWCHHVLGILEKEKLKDYIHDCELPEIVFSKDLTEQENFHNSDALSGLHQTIKILAEAGLVDIYRESYQKISLLGRKVFADRVNFWSVICDEILDDKEETLLKIVNKSSPQLNETPKYGWIKEVGRDEICSEFEIKPPPFETNEQENNFQELVYSLPDLLEQREFLKAYPGDEYSTTIYPTYKGLVWELKRNITIESKLIDELVKDWETTNVDFKQEIGLDTNRQKAKFARNVLGLATTKSSGKRYMIIGFDDKTREYFAPPDTGITQEIMEQHLANLTDPVVNIHYKIVDYSKGKVGKLEIIREPEKLPYRAKKDVIVDEKGKKGLEKDKIYVRHGSLTESPSDVELKALIEEGKRARGEI
ncbi:MAG: putative DNA binding domain-containing protein [Acidobacteriota bacterium]|nr:putative DNA binding domain-containing protein [Acidobacteriota bacterium]